MITDRIYIKGLLTAESPFLIGSYDDEFTDIVALRDAEGSVFIPGSSIAGALRNYFEENAARRIFGYTKKIDMNGEEKTISMQSPLITYDAFPRNDSTPRYSYRDGIRIDYDTGVVAPKAKYDYEIVEAGTVFDFRLEFIVREGGEADKNEVLSTAKALIEILGKGVYWGSKTNRGLGRFVLSDTSIYALDMTAEGAYRNYVDFDWENTMFLPAADSSLKDITTAAYRHTEETLLVNIKIPQSLLVREYSIPEEAADFAMLTNAAGRPVIPGTSWAGVFRHWSRRILFDLGCAAEKVAELLKDMYGSEQDAPKKQKRKASKVAFDESVIVDEESCKLFIQTQVKIDRFTQGAVSKALFNGEIVTGADTKLRIRYPAAEKWMSDLLTLVLADLNDGFVVIGGGGAVGRGICEVSNFEMSDCKVPMDALVEKITAPVKEAGQHGK